MKPSGDIRLCVDFRKLNDITVQEHCYIPDLEDILSKVSDSMALSKLDLTQGFHQIHVEPQSKNLTTFVCPYGRYRFNRMPFGLKNAPATFQKSKCFVLVVGSQPAILMMLCFFLRLGTSIWAI